jgi:hypothetical protein
MSRTRGLALFCGVLASVAAAKASAADERSSSCVACHLDEAMLAKSLSPTKAKKSSMQSGAG